MDASEVLAKLAKLFENVGGVAADKVVPDATIAGDLELDSLAVAEIAVAAEDEFGVKIPDSRIESFVTVSDLVRYIQAQLGS